MCPCVKSSSFLVVSKKFAKGPTVGTGSSTRGRTTDGQDDPMPLAGSSRSASVGSSKRQQ